MKGELKRYLSADGSVVCAVLDGTEMCREMERIHKTSAVCTAALGRLSMAASLIGYGLKDPGDSVTVRLDGGGPAGILVAVAGQLLQYARVLLQVGVEERVGVVKLLHLILIYIEYDVDDILVGTYGLGHLALAGLLMPSDAGSNEVFLVVVYLVERTL